MYLKYINSNRYGNMTGTRSPRILKTDNNGSEIGFMDTTTKPHADEPERERQFPHLLLTYSLAKANSSGERLEGSPSWRVFSFSRI